MHVTLSKNRSRVVVSAVRFLSHNYESVIFARLGLNQEMVY